LHQWPGMSASILPWMWDNRGMAACRVCGKESTGRAVYCAYCDALLEQNKPHGAGLVGGLVLAILAGGVVFFLGMLNDDPSASSLHEQTVTAAIFSVNVGLLVLWVSWLRYRFNPWISALLIGLVVAVLSTQ